MLDRLAAVQADLVRGACADLDGDDARALAAGVIADLVRGVQPAVVVMTTKLSSEAIADTLRVVRDHVLDALDAAADVRRAAAWFAAVSERALTDANRRFVARLDAIDDRLILLDPSARVVSTARPTPPRAACTGCRART